MPINRITSEPGGECFIVTLHFSGDLRLPAEIQNAIQTNTLHSRVNGDASISLRGLDREEMFGRIILALLREQQITPEYLFTLRHYIRNRSRLPHDSSLLSALNYALTTPVVPARIGDQVGLISLEDALRLQMQMQAVAEAATRGRTTIPMPQEGKNARALSQIKNFDYDLISANFRCPLSLDIMDDPVIDPTKLIVAIDPSTKKSFINPTLPEHYTNYAEVDRYERKWLETSIRQLNGISPNTRQPVITPLISDAVLKSQIDAFVKTHVDAYESRVMHHVIGDLYFKIESRDDDSAGAYDFTVIQNGDPVVQTILKQKQIDDIIANIRDIKKLKLIVLSCGSSDAPTIIRFITDVVKKQSTSVVASASALFGASVQLPSHNAAISVAPSCN